MGILCVERESKSVSIIIINDKEVGGRSVGCVRQHSVRCLSIGDYSISIEIIDHPEERGPIDFSNSEFESE